jgi:hypothetical protein
VYHSEWYATDVRVGGQRIVWTFVGFRCDETSWRAEMSARETTVRPPVTGPSLSALLLEDAKVPPAMRPATASAATTRGAEREGHV